MMHLIVNKMIYLFSIINENEYGKQILLKYDNLNSKYLFYKKKCLWYPIKYIINSYNTIEIQKVNKKVDIKKVNKKENIKELNNNTDISNFLDDLLEDTKKTE